MTGARPVAVALLVAVFALLAPAAARAAGTLAPPQMYPLTSGTVSDVAAGDVSGDGRLDVLGAQHDSGAVDALVQQPPASSETRPTFTKQRLVAGGNRAGVAAGDWDADGDTDYVTAHNGTLSTYVNEGAGGFTHNPAHDKAVRGVEEILVHDLNGDGDPDLLVASGSWSVLHGAAGATWSTRADYDVPFGLNNVTGLAVGDVNGDALPDVGTSMFNLGGGVPGVRIWIGTPDGGFVAGPELASGENASNKSVAIGDLNGDADPEVVFAANDDLRVWTGGSGASFSGPALFSAPGAGAIAMGDLDRDGVNDVVGGRAGTGTIRVYRGNGTGGFHGGTGYPLGPGVQTAREVKLADFDGDGGLDVYTANDNTTSTVLFNEVAANLGVTLSDSPDPVAGGSTVTYTAQVTNAGPDPATDASLTFAPPAGVPVESTPAGCTRASSAAPYVCALGDLANGASVSRAFVVRPSAAGPIVAAASVDALERDPTGPDDASEETVVSSSEGPADLEVRMTDEPDPVEVGEALAWTATVENFGTGAARDVVLTYTLPANTSFMSAIPGAGTCAKLAQQVRCELGTLAAGASVGVVIRALPTQAGPLTNVASVATSSTETGPKPNSASTTTDVVPAGGGGGGGPSGPTPGIAVGDATVTEGHSGTALASFTVTLAQPTDRLVSVDYATASGSAVDGEDFVGQALTTLVFPPGQTTKTIGVPVRGDRLDEPDETFTVNLSNPGSGTLTDAQGTGTIADDDAPPPVLTLPAFAAGTEGAGNDADFVLQLSRAADERVEIDVATTAGNAAEDVDYERTVETAVIQPGQSAVTVSVPLLGDALDEDNETFALEVLGVSGAKAGATRSTGVILDDDAKPTLSVRPAGGAVVAESGEAAVDRLRFELALSVASGRDVRVAYTTSDVTARAGEDYVRRAGEVTFAPGETSAVVEVQPLADDVYEGDSDEDSEALDLEILSVPNADAADPRERGYLRDDDPMPTLAISQTTAQRSVSEGDSVALEIVVSDQPTAVPVTFALRDDALQSTPHADYVPLPERITIAPGAPRRQALVFRSVEDGTYEPGETASFEIRNVEGAALLTQSRLRFGIDDDEPKPVLRVDSGAAREGEQAEVDFRLSPPSSVPVRLRVEFRRGTAEPDVIAPLCMNGGAFDALPLSRVIAIAPDQTVWIEASVDASDVWWDGAPKWRKGPERGDYRCATPQEHRLEKRDYTPALERPSFNPRRYNANDVIIQPGETLVTKHVYLQSDDIAETTEQVRFDVNPRDSEHVELRLLELPNIRIYDAGSAKPTPLTRPRIVDAPRVGEEAECDPGTWSGSPTGFRILWSLDDGGSSVESATYTPQANAAGRGLKCSVIAVNAVGSSAPAVPSRVRTVLGQTSAAPAGGGLLARDGTAGVAVGCASASCNGSVQLFTARARTAQAGGRARPLALGRASFRLRRGQRRTVRVKVSRRGRALVRRRGRVRVWAVTRTKTPQGTRVERSASWTLRAPRGP